MTRTPPVRPAQLLKRMVPAQNHEVLLGDLAEEYRRRSAMWYWFQILAAVAVGTLKDVRSHVRLSLRAGVLTVVLLIVSFFAQFVPFLVIFDSPLRSAWPFIQPAIWMCALVFTGRIVGRVYRRHGVAMVLAGAAAILVTYVGLLMYVAIAIGWPAFVSHLSVWSVIYTFLGQPLLMIAGGCLASAREKVA